VKKVAQFCQQLAQNRALLYIGFLTPKNNLSKFENLKKKLPQCGVYKGEFRASSCKTIKRFWRIFFRNAPKLRNHAQSGHTD
jgi:hypothetical protein